MNIHVLELQNASKSNVRVHLIVVNCYCKCSRNLPLVELDVATFTGRIFACNLWRSITRLFISPEMIDLAGWWELCTLTVAYLFHLPSCPSCQKTRKVCRHGQPQTPGSVVFFTSDLPQNRAWKPTSVASIFRMATPIAPKFYSYRQASMNIQIRKNGNDRRKLC